jgi:hypothetical protein
VRDWIIRHPDLIGCFLAGIIAWQVLEVYDAGRIIGTARALQGQRDYAASQALGG